MSLFVKKKVRGINGKMIGFYGGIVYNRRKIFLLIKEIYGHG